MKTDDLIADRKISLLVYETVVKLKYNSLHPGRLQVVYLMTRT